MQRSTTTNVINEEVKCTLRIVANNCFIFQIPHVDKKSYFGSFGGEHLHIKALCMANINCPFEIESKWIQIDRDGL